MRQTMTVDNKGNIILLTERNNNLSVNYKNIKYSNFSEFMKDAYGVDENASSIDEAMKAIEKYNK